MPPNANIRSATTGITRARKAAKKQSTAPDLAGTLQTTGQAQAAGQTIEYISELIDQLSSMATSINEDSLAYFLSMARAEAELAALRHSVEE